MTPDDLARRANHPDAYSWTAPVVLKAATPPVLPHLEFCCGHEWTLQSHCLDPALGDKWFCVECWEPRHITAVIDLAPHVVTHRHFYRVQGRSSVVLDSWWLRCDCGAVGRMRCAA